MITRDFHLGVGGGSGVFDSMARKFGGRGLFIGLRSEPSRTGQMNITLASLHLVAGTLQVKTVELTGVED